MCENGSREPGRGYRRGGAVALVFEIRAFLMGPPSTVTREMREAERGDFESHQSTEIRLYSAVLRQCLWSIDRLGQEVISAQAPNRPCEGSGVLRAVFV